MYTISAGCTEFSPVSAENLPDRIFSEIRHYFSKVAGNSADTSVNFSKNRRCVVTVELLLKIEVDRYFPTKSRYSPRDPSKNVIFKIF